MHVRVAIAGAGFGGLGTAMRLLKEGIGDLLVFEKSSELGGVWRENTYPGCACDVQSHLYSFSFAPNPEWSRAYSPAAEIKAYLERCARDSGVLSKIHFGTEITRASWNASSARWEIETTGGALTADVLVAGVGALTQPALPEISGRASFEGASFHSSRWDHSVSLEGKRVAVIGTGASAVQFVPQIQPRVSKLLLFQRTAPWIVPRGDRAFREWEKRLFRRSPIALRMKRASLYLSHEASAIFFLYPKLGFIAETMAKMHLRRGVKNPAVRKTLTPNFRLGCKRVLVSDDYLPSLDRDNVEVVTAGIREIRAHSIVTNDGTDHEVDAIVYGTGFSVRSLPFVHLVHGREGRTLGDVWGRTPRAHLGTTVAGFPNFFFLLGPNTAFGHTSVLLVIESQIEHVLGALRFMERTGAKSVEPSEDAQRAFVESIERKMRGTVWVAGGCKSWYLDEDGTNWTIWPGFASAFQRRVRHFRPAEYRVD